MKVDKLFLTRSFFRTASAVLQLFLSHN